MKIAINCSYFGERSGGLGEYIYNLAKNLYYLDNINKYIFYISYDQEDYWKSRLPFINDYKIIPYKLNQRIKRSLLQNYFWKEEEKLENFDLFHSPFYHIPSCLKCKTILTFHDLRIKNFPETYPYKRRIFIQYAIKNSIKKVDKIITVSQFTKQELIKHYLISPDQITPILEGLDFERFNTHRIEQKYERKFLYQHELQSKKYILAVGHLEPRKNYSRLIKAFDILQKKEKVDFKLVIVGKKYFKSKEVIKLISKTKNIIYLDFIKEIDLLCLYNNAYLIAFTSIYEGFGFPPLEAACFNVPSIVSNITSIPEVCGNGAVYCNPYNINDIAEKINLLLSDQKYYMDIIEKSKLNLKRFSWENNAKDTIEVFNEVFNKD